MRFQPSVHSYGLSIKQPAAPPADILVPQTDDGKQNGSGGAWLLGLGAAGVLALAAIPTFVVNPWIVKAFKPEMPYWRRVGIGMGITLAVSMASRLIKSGSGANQK